MTLFLYCPEDVRGRGRDSKACDELITKELIRRQRRKDLIRPAYQKTGGFPEIDSHKLSARKRDRRQGQGIDKDENLHDKNRADFTVQGKPIEFEKIKDMLTTADSPETERSF